MNIVETHDSGVTILALEGRLDADTAAPLEAQLGALVDAGNCRIVLDLAQVDFLNSLGLRVFLKAAKRALAGAGRIALCRARPVVREVLDITDLDQVVPIYDSRAAAIAAMA